MEKFWILILIFAIFLFWYYYENYTTELSKYSIQTNKNIKQNIKILHISDLHNNKVFVKKLQKIVNDQNPDIILLTGDFVSDKRGTDSFVNSSEFFTSLKNRPSYYVSGNHEFRKSKEDRALFKVYLLKNKVIILDENRTSDIKGVRVIGIDEGSIQTKTLPNLSARADKDKLNIVIMHHPEIFDELDLTNIDLLFAGHAHGGQWRIPFINQGILAPNQGLLPKYTSGEYTKDNSKLFVSRGVGTLTLIPRIFNRPHVIVVNIEKPKE